MPRPCHDIHPNPAESQDTCRLCYLYTHDATYRNLFDNTAISDQARSTSPSPCKYLAESLLGFEREQLGLDHSRDWKHCEHPTQPLGPVVCACAGCGVNCRGYTPEADENAIEVQTDGQGIGDAVSQLYACCGLADATGQRVIMRSRHDLGWFTGISHPNLEIRLHNGSGVECNPDYPGQIRASENGSVTSRCQWYCDRLADALSIPQFTPARPKRIIKPQRVPEVTLDRYAVVSPFSLHSGREWPMQHWRELVEGLVSQGIHPHVLGRPGDDHRLQQEFGWTRATWFAGRPPEWVSRLIANASWFVGNDSGMAHIAGMYGTPGAVVMSMFPFSFVFDQAPSLRGVGRYRQWLGDIPASDVLVLSEPPQAKPKGDLFHTIRQKLGQRASSTEWLFREIKTRWKQPQIIETGCVRSKEDWSAGYMTWLLGWLLEECEGGSLTSVDINPQNVATARRLCKGWERVEVVQADSLHFLIDNEYEIDVAYLDSLDTYEAGCAEHGLREAKLVVDNISENGLIVFDDTPPNGTGWDGKGRLAVPWLTSKGWRVRPESGYQTILERAK